MNIIAIKQIIIYVISIIWGKIASIITEAEKQKAEIKTKTNSVDFCCKQNGNAL